jgi:hypothetical protein
MIFRFFNSGTRVIPQKISIVFGLSFLTFICTVLYLFLDNLFKKTIVTNSAGLISLRHKLFFERLITIQVSDDLKVFTDNRYSPIPLMDSNFFGFGNFTVRLRRKGYQKTLFKGLIKADADVITDFINKRR